MAWMQNRFVSSIGEIDIPPDTAKKLGAAPRRKDGRYDRRYSASKRALKWEREAETLMVGKWIVTGELPSQSDLPPY